MSNKHIMNCLTIGIIALFIVSAVTPMVIGYESDAVIDIEIIERVVPESTIVSNQMDFAWPMYQHDAANTGFSPSPFPDSLSLSWNISYSNISNISFWSQFSSPIIANGKIFISGIGGVICAFNEDNGSLIWIKKLLDNDTVLPITKSPAVSNGKVFICLSSVFSFPPQSKIVALDEETGDFIWESSFFTNSCYPSVTIADDKVIVGGHFTFFIPISRLYVFDANNGDLIWGKTMQGYLESTPVVSDNKVIVATSCISGILIKLHYPIFSGKSKIYAFDLDDGNQVWKTKIKGHVIYSSPIISNGRIFIPSNIIRNKYIWARRITSLNITTGEEIWHYQIRQKLFNAWPTCISTPSAGYGKIFITDCEGRLFALDEENGDVIWKREIVDDVLFQMSSSFTTSVVDHKVITSAIKPENEIDIIEICLFNESNGDKIWSIEAEEIESIFFEFAIANGKLFVNAINGLYVYS